MIKREKFDIALLIASLAAGAVAWGVDIILYRALVGTMGRPLLMGIMFAVLALLVSVTVLLVSMWRDGFDEEFLFLQSTGAIIGGVGVLLAVVFLAAMLLEWIYDRDFVQRAEPTSYVFLIDDSGSMSGSDPNFVRNSAVQEVMQAQVKDFPFAVYCFSDQTALFREMAPYSAGETMAWGAGVGGRTMLQGALEQVYDDLTGGAMQGGAAPLVIVLTDGYASDIGILNPIGDVLKNFASAGISVSTVGLGNSDEATLRKIAEQTGGVYIGAENADALVGAMRTAAARVTTRDLLSVRSMNNDGLYAVLRILFLTILGALLALIRAAACARMGASARILILGAAAALLGALVMEFGLRALPMGLCWLLLWLLLSATPAFLTVNSYQGGSGYIVGHTGFGGAPERPGGFAFK